MRTRTRTTRWRKVDSCFRVCLASVCFGFSFFPVFLSILFLLLLFCSSRTADLLGAGTVIRTSYTLTHLDHPMLQCNSLLLLLHTVITYH